MVENIVETINWLAITVPFFAAWGAYETLESKAWPKLMARLGGLVVLAAIFAGYILTYRYVGFPMWMRWYSG